MRIRSLALTLSRTTRSTVRLSRSFLATSRVVSTSTPSPIHSGADSFWARRRTNPSPSTKPGLPFHSCHVGQHPFAHPLRCGLILGKEADQPVPIDETGLTVPFVPCRPAPLRPSPPVRLIWARRRTNPSPSAKPGLPFHARHVDQHLFAHPLRCGLIWTRRRTNPSPSTKPGLPFHSWHVDQHPFAHPLRCGSFGQGGGPTRPHRRNRACRSMRGMSAFVLRGLAQ